MSLAVQLRTRPLKQGFGVEIQDVDLARVDEATMSSVIHTFHRHGVMLVRGQDLSPDAMLRFARLFGPLETHTLLQYTLPDYPHIYVLSNRKVNGEFIGAHNEGIGWHTDLSYKDCPVMSTMLYGIETPPEGADTLIADMCAAYEALPAERQKSLEGKRIHHSYHRFMAARDDRAPLTEEQKALTPDVFHPLLRTHPADGRRSLYIGTGTVHAIEGMTNPEGKALVDELVEFATQERFIYRHKWQTGDLLMWDNRCTLHSGTRYDDIRYTRYIHRVMVQGDRPF